MTNYQLYRTNVLLGGQMKYDLIINDDIIDDFHISAIENNIAYKPIDDRLSNSHQENIKEFYNQTSPFFYRDMADPQLTSLYPLPENYNKEPDVSTYEMGLRKSKKTYLYNKEFEFFCPVWLEKITDISNLSFNFNLYDVSSGENAILIQTKKIKFSSGVTEYLNEYIKHIGLDKGCDWVFDINKSNSMVTGLNVKTGLAIDKYILGLYEDLTYRERPVLEFNNMIINELNVNNLITKQLFNFNLCFNLSDVIEKVILLKINNFLNHFTLNVTVSYDGGILETVDIFSNHQFIPKIDVQPKYLDNNDNESYNKENVLDYLQDYKCIDLIDKNKIVQNTCHWRLSANNLHFNVYTGFSPKYEDIDVPYISEDIANISNDTYIEKSNRCWCNTYYTEEWTGDHLDNKDRLLGIFNDVNKFSTFTSQSWVKGVFYPLSFNELTYNKDNRVEKLELICLITEGEHLPPSNPNTLYHWDTYSIGLDGANMHLLSYKHTEEHPLPSDTKRVILFCQKKYEHILRYKKILQLLQPYHTQQFSIINLIIDVLRSGVQNFNNLSIFNSLTPIRFDGPSLDTNEIKYYKSKKTNNLMRFFGKIKPYFIRFDEDYFNYKWKKIKWGEGGQNHFNAKFLNTQYPPLYPSVEYFSFQPTKEVYKKNGWSIANNVEK